MLTFADRLRMLIDELDLTQKQLASDLHIPTSTLGGYVQGVSEPDFETLKILAEYFNVSTDYLLNYHTDDIRSDKENDIMRIFRSLSPTQQDLYIEQGKAFLKINAKKNAKLSKSTLEKKNNIG